MNSIQNVENTYEISPGLYAYTLTTNPNGTFILNVENNTTISIPIKLPFLKRSIIHLGNYIVYLYNNQLYKKYLLDNSLPSLLLLPNFKEIIAQNSKIFIGLNDNYIKAIELDSLSEEWSYNFNNNTFKSNLIYYKKRFSDGVVFVEDYKILKYVDKDLGAETILDLSNITDNIQIKEVVYGGGDDFILILENQINSQSTKYSVMKINAVTKTKLILYETINKPLSDLHIPYNRMGLVNINENNTDKFVCFSLDKRGLELNLPENVPIKLFDCGATDVYIYYGNENKLKQINLLTNEIKKTINIENLKKIEECMDDIYLLTNEGTLKIFRASNKLLFNRFYNVKNFYHIKNIPNDLIWLNYNGDLYMNNFKITERVIDIIKISPQQFVVSLITENQEPHIILLNITYNYNQALSELLLCVGDNITLINTPLNSESIILKTNNGYYKKSLYSLTLDLGSFITFETSNGILDHNLIQKLESDGNDRIVLLANDNLYTGKIDQNNKCFLTLLNNINLGGYDTYSKTLDFQIINKSYIISKERQYFGNESKNYWLLKPIEGSSPVYREFINKSNQRLIGINSFLKWKDLEGDLKQTWIKTYS